MKAMLVDEQRRLVWDDVDTPRPGDHEILIETYAAAVNRADILQRMGRYPSPEGSPPWMGLEIAGVIAAKGRNVRRWKTGDSVCALLGGGGYAEYAAVSEDMAMPVPEGLSFEEAASLPEAAATCYLNLCQEGRMRAGETVYFPGGTSGLASVGIPMAKAFGAYVITSVRTPKKRDSIAKLHADCVICTSEERLETAVCREAVNGHPIDIALDCFGGEEMGACFPHVSEGCRWILISTLTGNTASIPLRALLTKGIELKGSLLRKRPAEEKAKILSKLVESVWPKVEDGTIRPHVHAVLPITEAAAAHAMLERGERVGKVVLKVR